MHDEPVNVTPLIDVVMCLIIFFLVVGRLVKDETNDKVVIPEAKHGLEMGDQQGRVVINLVPAAAANGDVITGTNTQAPTIFIRGQEKNMNDLAPYLRKEKRETPDIKIVLRADQSIPYQWIAPVLVACAQADIKSVNFSTKAEK